VSVARVPAAVDQDRLIARLQQLPRGELLALYDAAAEATECAAAMAQNGTNPVTEVLAGAKRVEEWAHFPPGDVIDAGTHSLFYYHSHAAEERVAGEHGHFHTFVRAKEIDAAVTPAPRQDAGDGGAAAHLVGISTEASGRLMRLFTTNRWVTGETWHDAEAVIGMLDHFDITTPAPSRELNRWVSATVRMFRPQIVDLVRARDAAVAAFARTHPQSDVYENRDLMVTSEATVDFLGQIHAIETTLAA
jgi:hypothetical protein